MVLQLIFVALILTVLFVLAVRLVGERIAQSAQDSALFAAAASIASSMHSDNGELQLDLPHSAFAMLEAISEDSIFYRVSVGSRTVTGDDELSVITPASPLAERAYATEEFRGEPVRILTVPRALDVEGVFTNVSITLAHTRQGFHSTVSQIQSIATGVGIGFFIVSVALCLLASQSALKPLKSLVNAIERRGPEDLRPVNREVPSEVAPLITALNSFIVRLSGSLDKAEEFIAEAAHRIRTPMALVQTNAEIALRFAETSKSRGKIREIIVAARESSRSASQLLDHATVAFRAENPQLAPISLSELIERSISRFFPIAEMKGITLTVSPTKSNVIVAVDSLLMQSAIGNVLDNAIKYSESDTTVDISYGVLNDYGFINISDQGPGFSDGDIKHATELFFRGKKTESTEGTGLGLKIVSDALNVHNGRLEITKNGERGSCVSLQLPLHS
nr:sensor histidine kinase [Ruegeria lacuscaerulensis]